VAPEEVRQIEPALSGDFYGGYYTESDFTGDIHRYATGLAKSIEKDGAVLRFGAAVESIRVDPDGVRLTWSRNNESQTDAFDAIVVCAGVESRAIGAELGDRVNVYPVKGYSITVRLDDEESQRAAPWISLLDDAAKVVTSRLGKDRFRIAGTAEFNGYSLDIRDDRIRPLVKWCERFFPGVSTEHAIPWAGLRPMMPNMMPRVGPGKRDRVFYNTGHGHLGWTLSAVTAEMVAETVAASHVVNAPAAAPRVSQAG
jgi:D-amino-acid dehydrogenase